MASSSRIGVLTFHRCINYGSYWQARCLVEALRARGHDAELLDHHDDAVARAEWRCSFQPLLPERTARVDLPRYKLKGRAFLAAIEALPLSPRFPLHAAPLGGYDAIVVGSDEVWNFRHPWYGGKSLFFGEGLRPARLVSYAASFGNHDAATGIAADWSARLARFTALSVRDDNSARLVRGGTHAEPALVLDPVLLHPAPALAVAPSADARYALIYGHHFPVWLQAAVRRWADRTGTRLVSIGYRNHWVDEHRIEAGPEEFARAVPGARALVTNFFHGCVFALIHGKPFVTAPSDYRFNKVRDLTASLAATRHVVTADSSDAAYDELLGFPLDPAIARAIATQRARSHAFLDAALA